MGNLPSFVASDCRHVRTTNHRSFATLFGICPVGYLVRRGKECINEDQKAYRAILRAYALTEVSLMPKLNYIEAAAVPRPHEFGLSSATARGIPLALMHLPLNSNDYRRT